MAKTTSLKPISQISDTLKQQVLSKDEIVTKLHEGLQQYFQTCNVNIYLLDSSASHPTLTYPEFTWPLPEREMEWLVKRSKDLLIQNNNAEADYFYIQDRTKFLYSDKLQFDEDNAVYQYHCNDGLYLILISEDELILGLIFIHNWANKAPVFSKTFTLKQALKNIRPLITSAVIALDNQFIHEKIETLLSDKQELKERIQKDEEDLKRRILELTVLYDTSNALSYALNHHQIVSLVIDSLSKVLNFDICSIFLMAFAPDGEIILRVNQPVDKKFIESSKTAIVQAAIPFAKRIMNPEKSKFILEGPKDTKKKQLKHKNMRSFANVPLIFKEEIIGMASICSTSKNSFPRNEMTFFHTIANQLASHLGRLKIVQQLEKSKMGSLIYSMGDGVIMFDSNGSLSIINPAAGTLLNLDMSAPLTSKAVKNQFKDIGILSLFEKCLKKGVSTFNQDIDFNEKFLSITITPVMDGEGNSVGTVVVIRDFTQLQKASRINTQRLEAISKVSDLIKSISDLNKLLELLMEFILEVAHAEMGAIQLKVGKTFQTKVHSNFPDKIRRVYTFKSGKTISEHTAQTKELCFIEDYFHNPDVSPNIKILINCYISIPIMVKNELIGIVDIARKYGNTHDKITVDDLETLSTITALSGSAIQNALLYQDTLKQQRLDQELKVATEIQTKLLPEIIPSVRRFQIGAISVPAREIGGDYYDFFELNEGKIGIAIADIVGKGIPAGLFMAMLKSILHTHFPLQNSPKKAMEIVNKILFKDPVINKFVPMFYAILDPKTNILTYCNAGHEPGFIYQKNTFKTLDTDGFPLGAYEDTEFEEKELVLNDSDIVVISTDGLVETQGKDNKSFGYSQMQKMIRKYRNADPALIVDKLHAEAKQFSATKTMHDDITILSVKRDDKLDTHGPEKALDTYRISVKSQITEIKTIRNKVDEIATKMGFAEKDIFDLKLAVNEAQANIIEHAYSGKETGEIIFQFLCYSDRLEIVIQDFGAGLETKTTKGEEEHLTQLEGSGLGMFLIKSMVDKVKYKRAEKQGTELWLTKYIN